jgi:predicted nucleic acid-binding protein
MTTAITLLEVLVVPYRAEDDGLASRYERLLTEGRGITLVEAGVAQARLAAQLRARTGIRVPDTLQLAAALSAGCTAFVTNDRALPSLPGLPVVQLGAVGAR